MISAEIGGKKSTSIGPYSPEPEKKYRFIMFSLTCFVVVVVLSVDVVV